MTDTLATPQPGTQPDTPPGTDAGARGTLDVRTRALQHIAERAVLDTPGTVAHRSALGRLRGSDTPRASVTRSGTGVRVTLDVACVWPCDVAAIATRVRDSVLTEAARLSGVHVSRVDVTIHTLSPADLDQPAARVR